MHTISRPVGRFFVVLILGLAWVSPRAVAAGGVGLWPPEAPSAGGIRQWSALRGQWSVNRELRTALSNIHAFFGDIQLTQITDTVYYGNGQKAQGKLLISWPAFTTATQNVIAAGSMSVALGANGLFNASLAPTTGSTPPGVYYSVVYQLNDDATLQAWSGSYDSVSDLMPAGDVVPGMAVQVLAPSWNAQFSALVREVDVQVLGMDEDRSRYAVRFANEAAAALALEFSSVLLPEPLATVFTVTGPSGSMYLAPLTAAQITDVLATQITIDAGVQPPAGGGIEVRRSDGGWGTASAGNLVGRFQSQSFAVPRLSRVQDYYLQQYDASNPAKYSRYSALLHVDYPYS